RGTPPPPRAPAPAAPGRNPRLAHWRVRRRRRAAAVPSPGRPPQTPRPPAPARRSRRRPRCPGRTAVRGGTGTCRRASARRHIARRARRSAPAPRRGRAAAGRAPRAAPAPRDRRTPRTPPPSCLLSPLAPVVEHVEPGPAVAGLVAEMHRHPLELGAEAAGQERAVGFLARQIDAGDDA